ncbi:MAG TPA: cytochrome c [Burkholderiales bacterium]|jgi:ubiquinol-cytochrome c reductase cytochrome c subunit|nr:cytochrome c [Burkholderiales bacterium]
MRFALGAFVLAVLAATPALSADAAKGKAAFMKNGCWQCHGEVGQGGAAGKTLAPKPMAFEAFNVFVRNSNGSMPPYPKEILSDADLADIHAYLQSIPAGKDYKSIPLLSQ